MTETFTESRTFRRVEKLMGTRFEVVLDHDDAGEANSLLDDAVCEIRRIESIFTEFSDTSATAAINRHAGIRPVQVPHEVYSLLERCQAISEITRGAFDITVGPLKKLYNFKGGVHVLPPEADIDRALQKTGYRHLQLQAANTVFASRRGMQISFAGIAKGYAADKARDLLKQRGVRSGAIDASGDLSVWGDRPRRVGIADPADPQRCLLYLPVINGAIATSGDYEQHFQYEGIRYSHHINPRSGLPLTGIQSVTVVSLHAELSDALSTAVYAMGIETGMHFINQLEGVHCIAVDENGRRFFSHHINLRHAG